MRMSAETRTVTGFVTRLDERVPIIEETGSGKMYHCLPKIAGALSPRKLHPVIAEVSDDPFDRYRGSVESIRLDESRLPPEDLRFPAIIYIISGDSKIPKGILVSNLPWPSKERDFDRSSGLSWTLERDDLERTLVEFSGMRLILHLN